MDAKALLQESRSPGVPSALSKAPVLCSPRSSSRWPRARTPRAAAATAAAAAAAAARAAVARARVAAVAAVAPGLGERQSTEDTRMGEEEGFQEGPFSHGSWSLHCSASGHLWLSCGLTWSIMKKF